MWETKPRSPFWVFVLLCVRACVHTCVCTSFWSCFSSTIPATTCRNPVIHTHQWLRCGCRCGSAAAAEALDKDSRTEKHNDTEERGNVSLKLLDLLQITGLVKSQCKMFGREKLWKIRKTIGWSSLSIALGEKRSVRQQEATGSLLLQWATLATSCWSVGRCRSVYKPSTFCLCPLWCKNTIRLS